MQAPDFPTRPIGTQLPNFYPGSCPLVGKGLRCTDVDRHRRFVQIRSGDQFIPVDIDDTLVGPRSSRHESDTFPEFVDGEPAHPLFTERKPPMPGSSTVRPSLLLPMVIPRYEPDRAKRVERHTLTVVSDNDRRLRPCIKIKRDDGFVGVCIVGVLDQLEDSQSRTADQLVAEQLQHPGPWTERPARFTQDTVVQKSVLHMLLTEMARKHAINDIVCPCHVSLYQKTLPLSRNAQGVALVRTRGPE